MWCPGPLMEQSSLLFPSSIRLPHPRCASARQRVAAVAPSLLAQTDARTPVPLSVTLLSPMTLSSQAPNSPAYRLTCWGLPYSVFRMCFLSRNVSALSPRCPPCTVGHISESAHCFHRSEWRSRPNGGHISRFDEAKQDEKRRGGVEQNYNDTNGETSWSSNRIRIMQAFSPRT